VAVGLGDCAVRFALQPLPDIRCFFWLGGDLPLLSDVARLDGDHLYSCDIAAAEEQGETQGPEDPWVRSLAEYLSKSDAKFYGASWCPHCAQQKELFGASVKRIPYVECSPGGPQAPSASICKEKNITTYPTWIINGQRYTGVQTLDALAQLTNFKYQGSKP
jgi:glutaredoxin